MADRPVKDFLDLFTGEISFSTPTTLPLGSWQLKAARSTAPKAVFGPIQASATYITPRLRGVGRIRNEVAYRFVPGDLFGSVALSSRRMVPAR